MMINDLYTIGLSVWVVVVENNWHKIYLSLEYPNLSVFNLKLTIVSQ